jgi:hypothetical protein
MERKNLDKMQNHLPYKADHRIIKEMILQGQVTMIQIILKLDMLHHLIKCHLQREMTLSPLTKRIILDLAAIIKHQQLDKANLL